MLPKDLVEHSDRAAVGYAGTRDDNLVPHIHHLTGWKLEPDEETMTCLVPEQFTPDLIASLEANGQVAVTLSASVRGLDSEDPLQALLAAHECYQFKGEYIGSRPVNEDDLAIHRAMTERAIKILELLGAAEDAVKTFCAEPRVAFSFKVLEAFEQTPGPGAGSRVFPEVR